VALCLLFISCKINRSAKDYINTVVTEDTSSLNSSNRRALLLVRKNPDSSIFFVNTSLKLTQNKGDAHGTGEAYWIKGLAYFYKYLYDSSLNYYNKAYNTFIKIHDIPGMAKTQFSMSFTYSALQNMPKSLECAQTGKILYEEAGDYSKVYDCIEGLIYIQKQLNNSVQVDSLVNELILAADKTGDKRKIANSFTVLGNHYVDHAYLSLAIEAFYKALDMAEEMNDPAEMANAMGNIGHVNFYMGEYKTSVEYLKKQEAILVNQNDIYELSNTYTGLGEAYNALKDYSAGLQYHLKSLELSKRMNFNPSISNCLHNIAYTYLLKEDSIDHAMELLNKAIQINFRISDFNKLARNYMLMGKIYVYRNNSKKAIQYLEKGLALAQQYPNPDIIMESSKILGKLYEEKKNPEKALAYLEMNDAISDSLKSGETFKRITQLEMQRTFEKKQNEIEMRHLQERMDFESKLKKNRLIRNYSFVVGILVVIFMIFMLKSYRKIRKADSEKDVLLKEIHHRVKNNLMVVSSLLNLQSGSLADDATKKAVMDSQSRVKSMALIHQLLYQSDRFTNIDFPKYLEQLMSSLHNTYCKPGRKILHSIEADKINLDVDTAIPLGLIINELATNAYKYAFTDHSEGRIEIEFRKNPDHQIMLRISDNGTGLPAGIDPGNSPSLGLKLVNILAKQIMAKLNFSNESGTTIKIFFSINT
jgi:two-component sensor histidine kinase